MNWDDLAKLAADPKVTLGKHDRELSGADNLKDAAALREMSMGQGGGSNRVPPRRRRISPIRSATAHRSIGSM